MKITPWLVLLVSLVALGSSANAAPETTPPAGQPAPVAVKPTEATPQNPALREELLAMAVEDQRVRKLSSQAMTKEQQDEWKAVDARNQKRVKEIIAQYGWPGRSLVGADGASRAWLLVQHCDAGYQEECLPLLEKAVATGEATGRNYAYLLDRVLMHQGKPQVDGTQFRTMDGVTRLHPVQDPEHLDERRRTVGLGPMAEYEKQILALTGTAGRSSINEALRAELLSMSAESQRLMKNAGPAESPEQIEEKKQIKARHLARMKEIIAQHGWPGRSLAGTDGAINMMLLVQFSGESKFMVECLPLMERAVAAKEARAQDYAYLLDRVRMAQGLPQVYGSQFATGADGLLTSYPIEDEAKVDERRLAVGLEPLAEYVRKARERQR